MRKENNLPHHGDRSFEGKNYTQYFFLGGGGGGSTRTRQKWAQNAPFASVFQKFSRGDPDPPTVRRSKISLFGFSSTAKMKIFPITYIEDRRFGSKNCTQFGGKNRNELGKNGLRMHHLHPFFKNFLGETPTPPPTSRR